MFKKIRIYLVSFLISFLVIYSIYYYKKSPYTGGGYVATADSSKVILMNPHPSEPSNKNIIFNSGIIYTLITNKIEVSSASFKDYSNLLSKNHYVGGIGKNNSTFLDKLVEDLNSKFPKHPPIQLNEVKEGDNVLFSYVFKNVVLPSYFGYAKTDLPFKGKSVKYIQYLPAKDSKSDFKVYQSLDKLNMACQLDLNDSDVLYLYTANGCPDLVNAWKDAQYVIKNYKQIKRFNDEFILFPEIDFFVNKHYTKQDLDSYFSPSINNFNYVEDRLKLKIGVQELKPLDEIVNPKKSYLYNSKLFVGIAKKGAVFPYIALMLNTPDILKR